MLHEAIILLSFCLLFATFYSIVKKPKQTPKKTLNTKRGALRKRLAAKTKAAFSGTLALVTSRPTGTMALTEGGGDLTLGEQSRSCQNHNLDTTLLAPPPKQTDQPPPQCAAAEDSISSWLVERIADPTTPPDMAIEYLKLVLKHSNDHQELSAALRTAEASSWPEVRAFLQKTRES